MKSLDKKKTKELDWTDIVKNIFFANGVKCDSEQFLIEDILALLTQQRTELLEEIKTRIDTWGGFEDDGGNLCHYDSEILEWVKDLLNKKDE